MTAVKLQMKATSGLPGRRCAANPDAPNKTINAKPNVRCGATPVGGHGMAPRVTPAAITSCSVRTGIAQCSMTKRDIRPAAGKAHNALEARQPMATVAEVRIANTTSAAVS